MTDDYTRAHDAYMRTRYNRPTLRVRVRVYRVRAWKVTRVRHSR